MKRGIAVLLGAILSAAAAAGNTDDLCSVTTIEQHGLRCKVIHYDDGSYPTLLIKGYVRTSDPEKNQARARLLTRQIIESHFREGGGGVNIRFRGKDGEWWEKPCNKGKGTYRAYCYEAVRVKE